MGPSCPIYKYSNLHYHCHLTLSSWCLFLFSHISNFSHISHPKIPEPTNAHCFPNSVSQPVSLCRLPAPSVRVQRQSLPSHLPLHTPALLPQHHVTILYHGECPQLPRHHPCPPQHHPAPARGWALFLLPKPKPHVLFPPFFSSIEPSLLTLLLLEANPSLQLNAGSSSSSS